MRSTRWPVCSVEHIPASVDVVDLLFGVYGGCLWCGKGLQQGALSLRWHVICETRWFKYDVAFRFICDVTVVCRSVGLRRALSGSVGLSVDSLTEHARGACQNSVDLCRTSVNLCRLTVINSVGLCRSTVGFCRESLSVCRTGAQRNTS